MKNIKQKNKEKGYALLFVIVIISIISALTAGLANTTLKQTILSSVAKDSQAAFFMSDTATECGFYAYYNFEREIGPLQENATWFCGGQKLYYSHGEKKYHLSPIEKGGEISNDIKSKPCFEFDIEKINATKTEIISKGYNFCDESNPRLVERAIKATITIIPE